MKKLLFTGLLLGLFTCANAQKADTLIRKSTINGNNEIKLNLLYTVLGLPEINYERLIANDMGLGVGVLIGVDDESDFKFGVMPHFRVYFGAQKAAGFFIEANAAVLSLRQYEYSYDYNSSGFLSQTHVRGRTGFGLGAAAGGKFLTKSGFVGEAYFGLGRIFNNNYTEIYPRLGITIGKRF